VDQSSPDYVSGRGKDRSLQRRFPIVKVRSRPKSHQKSMFFGPKLFGGGPQILDVVFKTDHVAKFRHDWPRDRGDLALKKKRKKQQQHTRAALHYRNGWP